MTNFGHSFDDPQALLRAAWQSEDAETLALVLKDYGDKIELDEKVFFHKPGFESNVSLLLEHGGKDLKMSRDAIRYIVENRSYSAICLILKNYEHQLGNMQDLFEIAVWKRQDDDAIRAFLPLHRKEVNVTRKMIQQHPIYSRNSGRPLHHAWNLQELKRKMTKKSSEIHLGSLAAPSSQK